MNSTTSEAQGFMHHRDFICYGLTWLVDLNYSSWRSYLSLLRPRSFVRFKFKQLAGYGFNLAPTPKAALVSLAALIFNHYHELIEAEQSLIFICQVTEHQLALIAFKNKMIVPQGGDSVVNFSDLAVALQHRVENYAIDQVFHNLPVHELAKLQLYSAPKVVFKPLTVANPNANSQDCAAENFLNTLLQHKNLRNKARLIPSWRNRYLQLPLAGIILLLTISLMLHLARLRPLAAKPPQIQIPAASPFVSSRKMLQLCLLQHPEFLIEQPRLRLVNLVCSKSSVIYQYTSANLESAQLYQLLGADLTITNDLLTKQLLNPPLASVVVSPDLLGTDAVRTDASKIAALRTPLAAKESLAKQNILVSVNNNEYEISGCLNPLSLTKLVDLGSIRLIRGMNDPKTQKMKWVIDGKFSP